MNRFKEISETFKKPMPIENYLIQLENEFDNLSWSDTIKIVNEANDISDRDPVVDNIIQYVHDHKRISFKQWKVLRVYINDMEKRKVKFKYGK
jgi:hypothetical protein